MYYFLWLVECLSMSCIDSILQFAFSIGCDIPGTAHEEHKPVCIQKDSGLSGGVLKGH